MWATVTRAIVIATANRYWLGKEIKMSDISRRKVLAGLAVAPLVGGVITRAGSLIDEVPKAMSPREKLQARYFPNFELTTHEGK
jgi:hypothetical protein